MKRSGWTGISILGVLAVLAIGARADDDSDRQEIEQRIDSKLGEMASDVGRVSSASSSSDIDEAISDAEELENEVEQLDRVKGDDSHARDIVDHYPDYVRSFEDAARQLKEIKDNEYSLDAKPSDCKDAEGRLRETIKDYISNADEKANEGLERLPDIAARLGDEWGPRLEDWRRLAERLANDDGHDRISSSGDRWSDVSSNLNSAAYEVFDHWTKAYDATKQACERLAKGKDHPDVVKALEDLRTFTGNVKQTYKQLEQDYRAWYATVKDLKKLTDDDRTELRQIMCTEGEYTMQAKVNEVADRWAQQIASQYGTITGQAQRLLDRADGVMKRAPKSAPKLKKAIQANLATIDRIKNSELKGANDPKILTRLKYGVDKHKGLQDHCDYSEVPISNTYCDNRVRPDSSCRVDCILTGSKCTIHEIKPNTPRGEDEAKKQLVSYVEGLTNWYKADRAALMSSYPKLSECEKGDGAARVLDVEGLPEYYDFCPKSNDEVGDSFEPQEGDVDTELQR
jgi:hypothetical protein